MALIPQEKPASFCGRMLLVFFFLYIGTLSFDYSLLSFYFEGVSVPFRWLAETTGQLFFGVTLLGAEGFYSDTLLVYVHVFNLVLIAVIVAAVWTFLSKQSFRETRAYPLLFTLLRYFLAFHLLIYGFSKIYKWQFMLPEPNILYTPVGEMHRDMLYWTSMGTSRAYSVFMGVIEIVPAILLLFRRTTLIGACVALMVLLNIAAVNFSFDIMVKLHSCILLLMSLVILAPGIKRIAAVLTGKSADAFSYPVFSFAANRKWISVAVKIAVVALLITEANYPYIATGNFNDDAAERPPMHGAYLVTDASTTNLHNPMVPEYFVASPVKMIFFHRSGYIIFRMQDGSMIDYPMEIDTVAHSVHYGYGEGQRTFEWQQYAENAFTFWGYLEEEDQTLKVQRIELSKLPLLEEEFTWIDRD